MSSVVSLEGPGSPKWTLPQMSRIKLISAQAAADFLQWLSAQVPVAAGLLLAVAAKHQEAP